MAGIAAFGFEEMLQYRISIARFKALDLKEIEFSQINM